MNKIALSLAPGLFGGLLALGFLFAPHSHAQPLEDEPGWDCHSMGNQQCGQPVLVCVPTERDGQLYLDQCDWYYIGEIDRQAPVTLH